MKKVSRKGSQKVSQRDEIFQKRLEHHHDELRWLYMELYDNGSMFAELCESMRQFYLDRNKALKSRDQERETDQDGISRMICWE